ncbi:MAG: YjgN family protein [bacterium]|nr:YjgN family protein [bacterium]
MKTPDGAIAVTFTGTAREYFGIWIVNLALSIATLGIWSAWAKVRNRAYILGNTSIDGRPFGYHARGLQVLLARLVVVAFLAGAYVVSLVSPVVSGIVGVLFLLAMPWLINRGLRFNAVMTSWSTVRFGFRGSYWPGLVVFVVYPFLSIVSLGLFLPYATRATKRYTIGGHRLGVSDFTFTSGMAPFWFAFFQVVACIVAGILVLVAIGAAGIAIFSGQMEFPPAHSAWMTVVLLVALFALFPFSMLYAAFLRNAIYAGTALENGHRFHSAISPALYVWIIVSNAAAVACSLGMLLPWARIRMARYLCARTWLIPAGSLDDIIDEARSRETAVGDAWMDLDGIDVGAAV